MDFDFKAYRKAKFERQTAEVPLPAVMGEFYKGEGPPVWKVQGLTGHEIGRVQVAAAKNTNIAAMIEAMAAGKKADKVSAYKKMLGTDETQTPQEMAEAFEKIVLGSIDPVVDIQDVLLLCERSAVAFFNIHATIKRLTDGGMMPGKSKGSTQTQESEPV